MNETGSTPMESLVATLREILRSPGYGSPEHRKAAFRRALHASSAGLNREQAAELLAEVESRFPDRVYESSARASMLQKRADDLEQEVARLKTELDEAQGRASALDQFVEILVQAAARASGDPAASASGRRVRDPGALRPYAEALARMLEYVLDQEAVVREFEAPMERAASRPAPGATLRQTIALLVRGEAPAGAAEDLQRRLKRLRRFPAALISGAQQSWRSGTTSVLKSLDPSAAKPAKSKWPRSGAGLEETRERFKSFWDQFDLNIDHYYRATFERIYAEAMEERR